MSINLDDNGVNGKADVSIGVGIVGIPSASMGIGCEGVPTSPFPAPNAQVSFSTTPTTATIGMSQSSPFANASTLTTDLFGITHNQGVGSPSPNNPFTIETNKYLKLKADGLGGSGYGIFIDPATPNIYYSLSNSTADRITMDNTGQIESVNVSSQRAVSISPNQINIQDFSSGANADLSTLGLFCSSSSGATTSSLTPTTSTITNTGATGGASVLTSNSLSITDKDVGGSANPPILSLVNTNATGSIYQEVYKNKPTAGANGDVLFQQSVFGKDGGNAKQEFTRTTHTIRDFTAGIEDGSIEMGCFVNGTYANFLQLNGNQNEVNCLKTLDMGGNDILTSTGGLNVSTTGSTGSGDINITGKAGSIMTLSSTQINLNSTGGNNVNLTSTGDINLSAVNNLIFTGTNLQSATSGGNSGQHLVITLNGVQYKIKLENP
jgi:hypothetical protein